MKKEEFMRLYYKHKISELCQLLGVSKPTIYKNLKEFDIKLKGRGGERRKKLKIED